MKVLINSDSYIMFHTFSSNCLQRFQLVKLIISTSYTSTFKLIDIYHPLSPFPASITGHLTCKYCGAYPFHMFFFTLLFSMRRHSATGLHSYCANISQLGIAFTNYFSKDLQIKLTNLQVFFSVCSIPSFSNSVSRYSLVNL